MANPHLSPTETWRRARGARGGGASPGSPCWRPSPAEKSCTPCYRVLYTRGNQTRRIGPAGKGRGAHEEGAHSFGAGRSTGGACAHGGGGLAQRGGERADRR